jgi:hypothetical protein
MAGHAAELNADSLFATDTGPPQGEQEGGQKSIPKPNAGSDSYLMCHACLYGTQYALEPYI